MLHRLFFTPICFIIAIVVWKFDLMAMVRHLIAAKSTPAATCAQSLKRVKDYIMPIHVCRLFVLLCIVLIVVLVFFSCWYCELCIVFVIVFYIMWTRLGILGGFPLWATVVRRIGWQRWAADVYWGPLKDLDLDRTFNSCLSPLTFAF